MLHSIDTWETWAVEIDCVTGEVKEKRRLDEERQKWLMELTLCEVSDQVEAR